MQHRLCDSSKGMAKRLPFGGPMTFQHTMELLTPGEDQAALMFTTRICRSELLEEEMTVTLREITKDNWRHCIALDPGPTGKAFIPSNLYALAESKFSPSFVPLGIYVESEIVGFIMYNTQPEDDGSYRIYSMMVDRRYQGKGYGTTALRLVIERLRQLPDCTTISLEYDRENKQAAPFYSRLGFRKVAESITGGEIAHLHLT
jgi:diamine N-acetyltransferase